MYLKVIYIFYLQHHINENAVNPYVYMVIDCWIFSLTLVTKISQLSLFETTSVILDC